MITTQPPGRVERYEQFFGFGEPPFSLAPNPRYLFESASHAEALAQVAYAIERREPLVVVTGEIGTGKTLLCRTVLQRLEPKTFVSVINNPLLDRDDLLKQLLRDFGVISKDRTKMIAMSRHDLVHALEDFLRSLSALQAHAVVVIDEAQHIQLDVLEQVRLLSNIDDPRGTMLQIVLVGQANLEPLLSRPELRQFQQRVSRRLRLEPLSADELRLYIEHRLAVARGLDPRSQLPGVKALERAMAEWEGTTSDVTFMPDAIQAVWTLSGGLPRVVNVLCDRALEAAFARRSRTMDAALIHTAALAIDLPGHALPVDPASTSATPAAPRTKKVLLAASVVLAALAIWFGARIVKRGDAPRAASLEAVAPSTGSPDARAAASPPSGLTTVPVPAAAPTVTPADRTAAGSTTADGGAASNRFEIVVASFRTDARAAAVAEAVSNLVLPVRRREVSGWQQVIAGPFASRAEADEAQQRLAGAGLTQTLVVRQNQ